MDTTTIKGILKEELPALIETDQEIRNLILDIYKNIIDKKADKDVVNDRFDKIIDEMRKDREEQTAKWEEQNKKWFEESAKSDAFMKAQDKKWDEQNKQINELIKLQEKKWDALHKEDEKLRSLFTTTIGALGARWGRNSEESFRNALEGILGKNFDIEVINYNEYDDKGEVFGYPDQVELDIIIRNGVLIICEIKSSISNSEMYAFYRKSLFYEAKHNIKASSYIVISPMVSEKAKKVASKFGIKVFTAAEDVDVL